MQLLRPRRHRSHLEKIDRSLDENRANERIKKLPLECVCSFPKHPQINKFPKALSLLWHLFLYNPGATIKTSLLGCVNRVCIAVCQVLSIHAMVVQLRVFVRLLTLEIMVFLTLLPTPGIPFLILGYLVQPSLIAPCVIAPCSFLKGNKLVDLGK